MAGELVARTVEAFYSGQWNDITADAIDEHGETSISRGVANQGGQADPGQLDLTLWNGASNINSNVARYALRNPLSDLHGLIGPNTPIRLSAGLVGDTPTVRMVGEAVAWPPRWDVSGRDRWVPLQAAGVLRRLGIPSSPLEPALTRAAAAEPAVVACWPLAGLGQDVSVAPPAVGSPARVRPTGTASGAVTFGFSVNWSADTREPGLGALPTVTEEQSGLGLTGPLPANLAPPFGWGMWARSEGDANSQTTMWIDTAQTLWLLWVFPTTTEILIFAHARDAVTGSFLVDLSNTSTIAGDDRWHNYAMVVDQVGGDATVTVLMDGVVVPMTLDSGSLTGLTVGTPRQARPTGTITTPAGRGLSIGYPTVLAGVSVAAISTAVQGLHRAGRGHVGEPAGDRVERLCLEQGVSLTGPGVEEASDEFGRTVASGWGSADSGQAWTTSGGDAADYSVSSGQGHIEIDTLSAVRQTLLDVSLADVDAYATFHPGQLFTGVPGFAQAGITVRTQDIDNLYQFVVQFQATATSTGQVTATIGLVSGGTPSNLAQVTFTDELTYDASTATRIRAQLRGNLLRMKVWDAADPEPVPWVTQANDDTITAAGQVGVRMALAPDITNTLPVTMSVDDLVVRSAPLTAPLGPQHPAEFLAILGEAAKVEAGGSRAPILLEQREAAGLHFNALRSLYLPRAPDLTLDYEEGQLSAPFDPTPDDFGLVNDATASRRDGGSARIEHTEGPKGITAAGRYDRAETFGVLSDEHLDGIARWWTLHGTWDEDRYPAIRINLRSLSTRTDGAALVAAVQALDPGALVRVANLPEEITEDIEQIVLGVTETISTDEWTIDLHTTPARPFTVPIIEDAEVGMLLWSSLWRRDGAIDTTQTALTLRVQEGPDLVHEQDFDVMLGGEQMTVTAIGSWSGTYPDRFAVFTVVRSVNGVVKSHPNDTQVFPAHPAYIGLWG